MHQSLRITALSGSFSLLLLDLVALVDSVGGGAQLGPRYKKNKTVFVSISWHRAPQTLKISLVIKVSYVNELPAWWVHSDAGKVAGQERARKIDTNRHLHSHPP